MNPKKLSRRSLLTATCASPLVAIASPNQLADRPPALDRELVQSFVGVAHGNLEQVKVLLTANPTLINATHDWGGGDFETALGAASHTGQREIALYLLEKGARPDIFTHAMLGDLETVQAALKTHPKLINTPGPHNISLIAHAEKGGEQAEKVLKYLKSLID